MAYAPEETRRRLLAAAVDEFSANGLAGARVDRIAQAAGVNKERIYAYFGSKEGLFGAVLESCLTAVVDEVPLSGEGVDAVLRYAGGVFDHHAAHPRFARLLAWESLERTAPASFTERSAVNSRKIARLRQVLPQLDDAAAGELLVTIVALTAGWQVLRSVDQLYFGWTDGVEERRAARRAFVLDAVRTVVESTVARASA